MRLAMIGMVVGIGAALGLTRLLTSLLFGVKNTGSRRESRDTIRPPGGDMDIEALQAQFRGEILTPGSPEYESSRKIWNVMIDRNPAAIARGTGPADVRAAVRFAADQNLYPAIRGGGHNAAGLSMLDDGLVIDLSRMKGIFVDPVNRTWNTLTEQYRAYRQMLPLSRPGPPASISS